ncbi:hypothetical protein [Syntrophomonas palmitatica]|nr:hypothetical protein [Syntrophomonas palmitatica]
MNIQEFISCLDGSDAALFEHMSRCKNPDEAYAAAQSYGLEASREDL